MIRKDLPKCPFCGAYASAWERNGGARIECSAWAVRIGEEHYVSIGGKTLEEAEKKWCERYAQTEDVELLCMKHYRQGIEDERARATKGLAQAFNSDQKRGEA